MLADSEPKEESCHSLDWVMAGKANKVGGSETGKQPHVEMEDWRSITSTRNASTYREEPTLTIEGWQEAL